MVCCKREKEKIPRFPFFWRAGNGGGFEKNGFFGAEGSIEISMFT